MKRKYRKSVVPYPLKASFVVILAIMASGVFLWYDHDRREEEWEAWRHKNEPVKIHVVWEEENAGPDMR